MITITIEDITTDNVVKLNYYKHIKEVYIMKLNLSIVTLLGASIFTTSSQANLLDHALHNIVGQASNAAGARLGDEIYYGSSRQAKQRKRVKHRAKKRTKKRAHRAPPAPRMTDEKYIQKALTSLGFYKGKIDGEVNSFETRSAIKAMNSAYGISNNASLLPQTKDTLIFLGTLFKFDRILIASGTHRKIKGKKTQTALKIHGFYHDRIDGVIGRGTRACIANYKREILNTSGTALDFEEEYQLISTAKVMNDKNIDESIESLKQVNPAQGQAKQAAVQAAPVKQMPALKAYQPANHAQAVQQKQVQPTVAKPPVTQPPVTATVPQSAPALQTANIAQ